MFFIDPSSKDIGRSFSSAPYYFTPSVRSGIGIEEEDFMLSPNSNSENFSFHLLEDDSPLIKDYWELRKRIFCEEQNIFAESDICLLYTSPSPRDCKTSRMPSSA